MNFAEFDEEVRKYFNLTRDEHLFGKLTYTRLIELLKVNTTGLNAMRIVDFSRGENTFGEFRFITLMGRIKNTLDREMPIYFTAYGHGYNFRRDCVVADTWNFYTSFTKYIKSDLPPAYTIRQLEKEHEELIETKPRNEAYVLMEELSDPDDAIVNQISE